MLAHQRAVLPGAQRTAAVAMASLALMGCQGPLDSPSYRNLTLEHPRLTGDGRVGEPDLHVPLRFDEEPPLGEDAALAEFLAYAAANNSALRSAFYRWRAAVERVPQATTLPDPMLRYGYFLEDFTARRAMAQHVFELSQTFPWFGKLRMRGDAAAIAAVEAAHEYEAVRLGLFLDVQRAFYELYQLGREVSTTEESLDLLRQFEAIVRARFRAGQATHADLARVQVELGRMEDRLRQLGDLRRPATARLNALLNRPADLPIAWPRDLPDERLDADARSLLDLLIRDNPAILALERQTERQRVEMELARRDYYPDVTLGGMYALRGEDPLLASISINVPIWREKYDAAVREANARRIGAAYERHAEVNRMSAELQEALFEHDDAQRRIELYAATLLPKARESLQASLTAYQAGTLGFLELLDAERTLLEFHLAESRARADRAIALARLDALVGSPVSRLSMSSPAASERSAPITPPRFHEPPVNTEPSP